MAQPHKGSDGGGPAAGAPAPMEAVWQDDRPERRTAEPALVVDVEGFEGPLDLLLHLARDQKVDLTRISVLELARQYLAFVEGARALRIELAADYLVMAAWLAYLKSRLLIPRPKDAEEPSGEEMAAILRFRLRRLEAMREAAAKLVNGNRLGRDIFARGMPETVVVERRSSFEATLYDLLAAYGAGRQRTVHSQVRMQRRNVWSLTDARAILTRLVGTMADWTPMDAFILAYVPTPRERVTALASGFAASLEMVREGTIDMRQDRAFGPVMLRDRTDADSPQRATEAN